MVGSPYPYTAGSCRGCVLARRLSNMRSVSQGRICLYVWCADTLRQKLRIFFFFFSFLPQLYLWVFTFFFFCIPQPYLWGSPFFFFFCLPQLYLWGSHSSSSAFPSHILGVHHSSSFSAFPSYISGVHHFWVRFLRFSPFF